MFPLLRPELDKLLEDAPVPFMMQQATKISGVRRRVSSLNVGLKSIQRRLDSIDRVISHGSSDGMRVLFFVSIFPFALCFNLFLVYDIAYGLWAHVSVAV